MLALCSSTVFAGPSIHALAEQLQQSAPGQIRMSYHAGTGKVRFLSAEAGQSIPNVPGITADSTSSDAAEKFLSVYGPLFGINDPAQELKVKRQMKAVRGRSFVRYQQVHNGVPVFGGELVVQLDAAKNVVSAHGKVSPDISADVTPTVDLVSATEKAIDLVSRQYNIDASELTNTSPELWIYNPVLLGHDLNRNFLVWRIEVSSEGSDIKELVLVDAAVGSIALHFNQVPNAKSRTIYDNQNLVSQMDVLPGLGPVRTEGQGAYGITDVDNAYDHMGFVYDFYWTYYGRDSIDNAGMILKATVRHCSSGYACPMQNAFWNGSQMVFGNGFPAALDVVGHELTHGVTQYESGLFYYMQSGAISESLSDVWGELIQQTYEPPAPASRWLLGENLSGGANRSMSNPLLYGDPDKMTSGNYSCGTSDNGGVHTNSSVGNKAAYLMVDGNTFNGKTVTGIGITKTIKIYYEAQTNLLMTSSDYADLYDVLQLACNNLLGTSGITVADCEQVKNSVDAVEMNLQPTSCSMCPADKIPVDLFFDNFDSGLGNWTHGYSIGSDAWVRILNPFSHSATDYIILGSDYSFRSLSYTRMNNSVLATSNTYMQFNHLYDFEWYLSNYYDGGIVAYSTYGGSSWTSASALFSLDGYNGYISNLFDNPYAGYAAFVGTQSSLSTSRLNLASLSGQNVMFRFDIVTDSSNVGSWLGWGIDNVRIYDCRAAESVTINTSPSGRQIVADGITYISPESFTWPQGTSHALNVASPQAGTTGTQYVFSSWSDGGNQSHSIVTPNAATTYTANFTTQYLLTLSVSPTGAGSIDASSGYYDSNAVVNLGATANTGYAFSSWSGNCSGTSNTTSVTMTSPKTCTANFIARYQVTTSVNPPGSGGITPDCSGGCWYNSGTTISFSPTPSGSNTFMGWTGSLSSFNAPLTVTVNGTKNITANFDSTAVTGTVRIVGTPPAYFNFIGLAYAAANNDDVIQMQATPYAEALTFDRTDIPDLSITLKGGYNSTYSNNTGKTIVSSPLTVQSGTIIVDNIVIQ